MEILKFTKMVGAGNDFIIIEGEIKGLNALAKRLCDRKTGIGADGILALEESKTADLRMRVFNADGSEAEMCGNGLRCAVLFKGIRRKVKVETKAGIYEGEITGENRVKARMEEPKDLKLNIPLKVNTRKIKVHFVNTGVPHVVVFVSGIDKIDVDAIGSAIRYHKEFKPKGANVNFVEIMDESNIKVRTYERGVEGETLSCGTGSVASAIITNHIRSIGKSAGMKQITDTEINVHTAGGVLKAGFKKILNEIRDVYLEGETRVVFTGQVNL
ncbi:MAG: diaminopimelate epimerase [Candidatus Omnitrophota bacterium]|jgi:diaminopimelate epimerase